MWSLWYIAQGGLFYCPFWVNSKRWSSILTILPSHSGHSCPPKAIADATTKEKNNQPSSTAHSTCLKAGTSHHPPKPLRPPPPPPLLIYLPHHPEPLLPLQSPRITLPSQPHYSQCWARPLSPLPPCPPPPSLSLTLSVRLHHTHHPPWAATHVSPHSTCSSGRGSSSTWGSQYTPPGTTSCHPYAHQMSPTAAGTLESPTSNTPPSPQQTTPARWPTP